MKTADCPPYFIDPPDHSSDSEEENALWGYIGCDIPLPGVEPLRTGDIIRFKKYPVKGYVDAQIIGIRSFDESTKKGLRTPVLADPFPVQHDQSIRRIATLNYKTGELEDNRKWSHSNQVCNFRLIHLVTCVKTAKAIKCNRLGNKVEVKLSNLRDIVDKLHDHAGDDLTRSFLTIVPNQPQLRLKDQNSIDDMKFYNVVEDIFYKAYYSSEEEGSNNESNEELSIESGESSDESVKIKSNCVIYVTPIKSSFIQESC